MAAKHVAAAVAIETEKFGSFFKVKAMRCNWNFHYGALVEKIG